MTFTLNPLSTTTALCLLQKTGDRVIKKEMERKKKPLLHKMVS